ncbi:MAG: hypothetical protein AAF611_10105 [Bacteroidota bacterium]
MSVKDFFVAVIKIMAIYTLIQGIIPIIAQIIYLGEIDEMYFIFGFIGVILLFLAIIYFMLSRADAIVKFLRLEKGFSTDRFDFSKVDSSYIVEKAIAIIGIYLIVITLPYILIDLYALIKENINSYSFSLGKGYNQSHQDLLINLIYILTGLVIIFLRKPISTIFTTNTNEK